MLPMIEPYGMRISESARGQTMKFHGNGNPPGKLAARIARGNVGAGPPGSVAQGGAPVQADAAGTSTAAAPNAETPASRVSISDATVSALATRPTSSRYASRADRAQARAQRQAVRAAFQLGNKVEK